MRWTFGLLRFAFGKGRGVLIVLVLLSIWREGDLLTFDTPLREKACFETARSTANMILEV